MTRLARFLIAGAGIALIAFGSIVSAAASVDFSLFDSVEPIGEGAADPRPREGEVLLLQFWASWCHSCGSLMWDMDEIASRGDSVKYVAVSLDDEADAAATYIRKHGLFEKYANRYFLDTDKKLSVALDVETVPTILLVTMDGGILLVKSGHLNSTDLNDIVSVIRNNQ